MADAQGRGLGTYLEGLEFCLPQFFMEMMFEFIMVGSTCWLVGDTGSVVTPLWVRVIKCYCK